MQSKDWETAEAVEAPPRKGRGKLRTALGDLLVLRHYPVVAAAVLVAGLVVGLTASMGPLFRGTAGDAAIRDEVAATPPITLGVRTAATATGHAVDPEEIVAATNALDAAFAELDGFAPPISTIRSTGRVQVRVPIEDPPDDESAFVVWRSGFTDHIDIVEGDPATSGLWLTTELAEVFDVGIGDTVAIGAAEATIAGLYRDIRTDSLGALGSFWQPISGLFLLPPPGSDLGGASPPPPTVLADLDTMAALRSARAARAVLHTIEMPYIRGEAVDLATADADRRAIASLRRDLLDPNGRLMGTVARLRVGEMDFRSGLAGAVAASSDVRTAITAPVALLTVFGLLVGLVVVAAAMSFAGEARRSEAILRLAQGLGPREQAARTAREVVVLMALGSVVGAGLGVVVVTVVGPAGVPPVASAVAAAAAVVAALVAAVGVAAAATAAQVRRLATPPATSQARRGTPPWELVPASLAAAAGYQVLTRGDALAIAADGGLRIDVLILAFPILTILTVVGVGTRLLRPALALLARLPASGRPALLLVSRRLAGASGPALGLVGSVGLAAGLLVYATTTAVSTELTVNAKRSVAAGAEVTAITFTALELGGLELGAPSTVVRTARVAIEPAGVEADLLAIDTATFADVADLDERWLGADPDVLLSSLGPRHDDRLAALAVGLPGDARRMVYGSDVDTELTVIHSPPGFPGLGTRRPLVVVDVSALRQVANDVTSLNRRMTQQLWAASADELVVEAMDTLGAADPILAESVITRSGLRAYTWTLDLLQGLAGIGVILAGAGILLFLRARQRRSAIAYALSRRMGLSASTNRLALVTELMVLLGVACGLGASSALAVAALTLSRTDPLPAVPPSPLLSVPPELLPAVALGVLAAALAAGAWAQRRADRARTAEVLRLAE